MSDAYTREQQQAFYDEVWGNYDPYSGDSSATCPNDGYQMTARVYRTNQRRAPFLTVACRKCGQFRLETENDPRADTFRDWTDDEKQEMVDRHFQGKKVACPVDGTAIGTPSEGDLVNLHCYRCGQDHTGSVHHRIGTKPVKIEEYENIPVEDVQIDIPSLPAEFLEPWVKKARLPTSATMEKRYQVFVSSTFNDLKTERQHATWALQAMECIPSGMELFPASDDDQWTLIKRVIDDCDYYLLIIAGRYGSLDKDGVGYTEKEYDYALSQKKPVIAFLHGNPRSLPLDKSEEDAEMRKKLDAFREKARQKMVQFWNSPEDLAAKISTSLHALMKSHPAEGWVKARYANQSEVQLLRDRVAELEDLLANKGKSGDTQNPSLPVEAVKFLKAAAITDGVIFAQTDTEGFTVYAGDENFKYGNDQGMPGRYEGIIRNLHENGLIFKYAENTYALTEEGKEAIEFHNSI